MWLFLIMGIAFIATGFAIHVLKWHFLIAGYNTMPKDKRQEVDVEGLGRLMGIYSYINGGVFILSAFIYSLGFELALISAVIFTLIATIFLIIRAQKYGGNLSKGPYKYKSGGVVISVISLIVVLALFYSTMQPTRVNLLEEGLEIEGIYGGLYHWEEIEEVHLLEKMPKIKRRTSGAAVGSHLKGHFSSEIGPVKLFVNKNLPPFILLETAGRDVIFNMGSPDETLRIFDEILIRINNLSN